MLLRSFLLFVLGVLPVCSSHAAETKAEPAESVFFAFDDESLAWRHNLKLTLVAPEKHPANPVVRCGPKGSPDYGHAILYGTVLHDGGKFRKTKASPGMNYLLERVDQKLAEFPVLKTHANDRLLFDVDLFLRSAASYVQLVPTAETTSSDEVGFAFKNTTTDAVLFELRTRSGTWHCGTDGKLTDTKIPAAFDAWNHLQLALDSMDGRCQVLLQVIGEAPRILDQTKLSPSFAAGIPFKIELICDRKQARDDGPAFDNLQLTRVAPQESREGNR